MKYLFLILLSLNAMASNWMPLSVIQSQGSQGYQLEADCKRSGEQCLDVGDSPSQVTLGFITTEDKFLKSEVESCTDETDCEAKFQVLICDSEAKTKIKNLDLLQVYCVLPDGKKLVVDSAGFSAYEAAQFIIAQQKGALSQAKKLRDCGSSIMDLVLVRNSVKGLTTTQIKAMVTIYAPIKGLLETGSLASAKEEVQAITPDGTLVTAGDKAAVIAAIDGCIGGI